MKKSTVKKTALVLLTSGCLFQLGCLGGLFGRFLQDAPGYLVLEYLTDGPISDLIVVP